MTTTTGGVPGAWRPDVTEVLPAEAVPDALAIVLGTQSGSVEGDAVAVRVGFVAEDGEADFVEEGATIAITDATLDEISIYTSKVARLTYMSYEQWQQSASQGQLSAAIQRSLVTKADAAFLSQPAPGPATSARAAGEPGPTGLLNITGITEGPAVAGDLDSLIDLQATMQEDSGGAPTHWLLSPTAWASLRKIKRESGSAESLLGVGTNDAQPTLLDLPVVVSAAVPSGSGLLIDRAEIVTALGQVRVATSDQASFASDLIAVRATWRIGWGVPRPARLASFTVTAPA